VQLDPIVSLKTDAVSWLCRRLTFEEKEELYRQRPDLEIGPAPYYNEKVQEMNTRNQRRIIFAMFGGMLSIVLLLIIYSVLAGAGQLGPM
jgi:hypothetical protein